MIRSSFANITLPKVLSADQPAPVMIMGPQPNRVTLLFSPASGDYVLTTAGGGKLLIAATGERLKFTREQYGNLLDQAWYATTVKAPSGDTDAIDLCVLVATEV